MSGTRTEEALPDACDYTRAIHKGQRKKPATTSQTDEGDMIMALEQNVALIYL